MPINKLQIGEKTNNQGVNDTGKLTAKEFNQLVDKVNEMIATMNNTVYISQDEYDALVNAGQINPIVEYNIFEE